MAYTCFPVSIVSRIAVKATLDVCRVNDERKVFIIRNTSLMQVWLSPNGLNSSYSKCRRRMNFSVARLFYTESHNRKLKAFSAIIVKAT